MQNRINNIKSLYIETAFKGCFNISLDCNYYKELFLQNSYFIVKTPKKASVILLAMCTGESHAQRLSTSLFNRLKKYKERGAEVVIGGCITTLEKKEFTQKGYFAFTTEESKLLSEHLNLKVFLPNSNIRDSLDIHQACLDTKKWIAVRTLAKIFRDLSSSLKLPFSGVIGRFLNVTRAYEQNSCIIRVSKGCAGKCTYCTEREARGALQSRPIETIINEIKEKLGMSYNHFTLVSDDLGFYGLDIRLNFCDLLKSILSLNGNFTLTLRCLNPQCLIKNIDEFVKIIVPGRITDIESPVQSGNNRILSKMGRGYRIEGYIQAFKRILEKDPRIAIKTHIIVGFADETEAEFNDTISLVNNIPIDKCNITYYTVNTGTPASLFDNRVSQKEKISRHRKLVFALLKSYLRRSLKKSGH